MAKLAIPTLLVIAMILAGCGKRGEVLSRFTFVAVSEQSAFAQTRANFAVEFDSSTMGVFVTAIDGVRTTKTAYWLYFVNGQPAKQACNAFVPERGDTIEWRLVSGY